MSLADLHTSGLTVAVYNQAEALAKESLSADHIRAFSTVTFALHGYPGTAETDGAVLRYVDTMQELNDPLRHHERETYSTDEGALVQGICEHVVALTRARYGRSVRPWQGPLTTMTLFRAIQALAASCGKRNLRVLEIGPGSGYLGALLIAAGHRYVSTDIAQGFYLWQHQLYRALVGDDFVEGVTSGSYPYSPAARAEHVPWWHYATLYRCAKPPEFDLVVCDHALGEMHPYALRYTCQLAQMLLQASPLGMVVCESVGEPRFHSEEAVRLNFVRVGLDHSITGGPVKAFGMAGKMTEKVADAVQAPPIYNPSGNPARVTGKDIIPIRDEEAPLSYELYRFLGYDTPRTS